MVSSVLPLLELATTSVSGPTQAGSSSLRTTSTGTVRRSDQMPRTRSPPMAEPPMPRTATARGSGHDRLSEREMRQASSSWSGSSATRPSMPAGSARRMTSRSSRMPPLVPGPGSAIAADAYPLTMLLPSARRASRSPALLASV